MGVVGGIPTSFTKSGSTINTTGDGTDRTATINAALTTAAGSASLGNLYYVELGAGSFTIAGTITIPKFVKLIGQGIGVTNIVLTGTGFRIGSDSDFLHNYPASNYTITAGATKGSTVLTVGDTTDYVVGNPLLVSSGYDFEVPIIATAGVNDINAIVTNGAWNQMVRIVSKTATQLTIFPALYDDYSTVWSRCALMQLFGSWSGLEEMSIDAIGSSTVFVCDIHQSFNCWIKGVRFDNANNYHLSLYDSLLCSVTECEFGPTQGSGSNHAGILMNTDSACYIYNNIFDDEDLFPIIEINQGSAGNVIAYNFLLGTNVGAGIDTNHGPHNQFNLYEGNYAPNFESDGYFGSERYGTIFRNYITCVLSGAEFPGIILKRMSRDFNVIGNLMGQPGISRTFDGNSYGTPNIGNGDSNGTAAPRASSAILTTRTNATSGTITGQSGHTVTTGATIDITWNAVSGGFPTAFIRRGVTVGTVSGTSIPFSGGNGPDLPSAASTVYIPNTNPALAVWWNQMNASGSTVTGTLTTRTSDDTGVVTLSGTGRLVTGMVTVAVYWATGSRFNVNTGTISGGGTIVNLVPGANDSGDVLPTMGTAVWMFPGSNDGFQELDLDVLRSAELLANWYDFTDSIPAVESIGSDTLPDSLYLSAKPDWFGDLAWPPWNPFDPNLSSDIDTNAVRIPAGYRYVNGDDPPPAPSGVTLTVANITTLNVGG